MKKTLAFILALIIALGCLSACGQTGNENSGPAETAAPSGDGTVNASDSAEESAGDGEASAAARTVTDMTGNEIELPAEIERVYFDWASGITLAMTLGAADKVIAKPAAFEEDTFAWAREICPAINDVPTENEIFTSGNVEGVLSLEPDLVVTSTADNIEAYTNLGLTAIYVKFNDYASFKESLLIVGTALGDAELAKAIEYNNLLDANIAMVQERTSSVPDAEKKTVYYVDSRFNDAYHTIGTGEIQEDWIVDAGGILATDGHFEGRNIEITAEKFLEIDPDLILIGAQNQAGVYEMLMEDAILSELHAVKSGDVYRIPQGIFPWCRTGPEAAIHVIWAGQFLHPELFEDIDIMSVARDFYKEFYGTDVSDEHLEEILAGHLCPGGK